MKSSRDSAIEINLSGNEQQSHSMALPLKNTAFPYLIQLKLNDLRYLKIYHINWPALRDVINMTT